MKHRTKLTRNVYSSRRISDNNDRIGWIQANYETANEQTKHFSTNGFRSR